MELEQVRKNSFYLISAITLFTFVLFGFALTFSQISTASSATDELIQNEELTILEINTEDFNLEIKNNSTKPKHTSEWKQSLKTQAVINGAFFEGDKSPSGYLKIDNKVINDGTLGNNFTAYLAISDTKIKITEDLPGKKFQSVLQGYPLLIKDGTQHLTKSTPEQAIRSAIAVSKDGTVFFIISNKSLSLLEFTQAIVKTNLPIEAVLNLDGGPSSGLYSSLDSKAIQRDNDVAVPSVVFITKK